MEKSNIERFDEMCAEILGALYESFPFPAELSVNGERPDPLKLYIHDPKTGMSQRLGKENKTMDLFEATAEWLVDAGFISKKPGPGSGSRYILTANGLQSLKHVSQPSITSETLGEQLTTVAKKGVKAAASEIMNQVLNVGTALVLHRIGIQS